MKKLILLSLIASCIFLLASCDSYSAMKEQSVKILSIGIDYKNSPYVNNLDSTVSDALEFGYALKSQYDGMGVDNELIYMIQRNATSSIYADEYYPDADRILAMIKSLEFQEDDLFVFYYSGHGERDDSGGASLACATYNHQDYTVLPMEKLMDAIEGLPCRSILILDCCYSGSFSNQYENSGSISFKESLDLLYEGSEYQKVSVLAACQAEEESYGGLVDAWGDDTYDMHGSFTYELLRRLGWEHSPLVSDTVTQGTKSYDILGRVVFPVKGLTTKMLFDSVMSEWNSEDMLQTPMMYGTNVSVCLIPRF